MAQVKLNIALLSNGDGILQRLWNIPEKLEHGIGGLEVELRCGVAPPVGIVPVLARTQAEHYIVGLPVLFTGIVAVVGCHQGQVQLTGQPDIYVAGGFFFGNVVAL